MDHRVGTGDGLVRGTRVPDVRDDELHVRAVRERPERLGHPPARVDVGPQRVDDPDAPPGVERRTHSRRPDEPDAARDDEEPAHAAPSTGASARTRRLAARGTSSRAS